MQSQLTRCVGTWVVTAAVALATVGASLAQAPAPATKGKGAEKNAKGGLKAPGGVPPKKLKRHAADPFANQGNNPADKGKAAAAPVWPFHYKFKITAIDNVPLAAVYYPAQRGTAAVVMLVHEKGRSGKDFEDGIEDLHDKGLAEFLQSQGYAVLVLDLRGHGANPRREVGAKEGKVLVGDLQAAYQFLVDRHNREELNLAKLGVVAVGEGANLVAAWAATPGAAVSSEGRVSDLEALVLVSPVAEGFGSKLSSNLASVAPRVPMLLMAGERDAASFNPVKDVQATVARQRQSKVDLYPTSLHGYKLLRFQPKVADAILAFFEATIKKARIDEWEPRYNLSPVVYGDIELVAKKAGGAVAAAQGEEAKKEPAKEEDAKKAPAKEDDAKKAATKKEGEKAPAKAKGAGAGEQKTSAKTKGEEKAQPKNDADGPAEKDAAKKSSAG